MRSGRIAWGAAVMAFPVATALSLRGAAGATLPQRRSADAAELQQGEAAIQARDWERAERLFREVLERSPRSARAHSDLAIVLTVRGNAPDEAVAEARRATELAPSDTAYRVRYGATLDAAGRLAEARQAFLRARVARPGDREILMLLADCSARLHENDAVELLRRVIAVWPENRAARSTLAEYLWDAGDASGGDAVIDEALRAFPDNAELHAEYGRSLLRRLQFARAIEQFSRARALGRAPAPLLNALGEACWEAGRPEEARAHFEASIAADAGFLPPRMALGRLLAWMGRPAEAARTLQDAVRIKEDSAPAQWNLGRALIANGDLDGAEKALRRAVELEPGVSRFHYSLATLLKQRERPDAGAEFARYRETYDAEQRATFEASSRRVELNGALDALRRGNVDDALARFRALPESGASLEGQAEALARQGRHREALTALERANVLAPDDAAIRAALAREYSDSKEKR